MILRASSSLLACALAVSCLVAPAVASAQGTVTASFQLTSGGQTYGSFGDDVVAARGQSFTAEVAGRLESVSFRTGHTQEAGQTVTIGVHAVDGSGLPVVPPLTSKEFPSSALPLGALEDVFEFDLSDASTQLQEGVTYVITMSVDPLGSGLFFLNGSFGENATYAGGQAFASGDGTTWAASPGIDFHFEVRVDDTVSAEATTFGAQKARYAQ